jgi:hypothetical protein
MSIGIAKTEKKFKKNSHRFTDFFELICASVAKNIHPIVWNLRLLGILKLSKEI